MIYNDCSIKLLFCGKGGGGSKRFVHNLEECFIHSALFLRALSMRKAGDLL